MLDRLRGGMGVMGMALLSVATNIGTAGEKTKPEYTPEPMRVSAVRATTAPTIDGVFDDEVWTRATAYPMAALPGGDPKAKLTDGGTVRFAWDEDWFYLAADMVDGDVLAHGTRDNMLHFEHGDLVELFLRCAKDTYYWEMYGTPAGRQSTLFFWSRGSSLLHTAMGKESLLRVAAKVDGSLNDPRSPDRGFTVEMAVPAAMLREHGAKWGAGTPWRILVARYNYGRNLETTEFSAIVPLSEVNFHKQEEYAELHLEP